MHTVTTDTATFNSKQLKDTNTLLDKSSLGQIMGLVMWSNPSIGYVASDLAQVKGNPNQGAYRTYLAVQVHEIGNSIAMLLGDPLRRQFMKDRPKTQDTQLRALDGDPGMALEECVFGAEQTKERAGFKSIPK